MPVLMFWMLTSASDELEAIRSTLSKVAAAYPDTEAGRNAQMALDAISPVRNPGVSTPPALGNSSPPPLSPGPTK